MVERVKALQRTGEREVIAVPEELENLLGFSSPCGCGQVHSIDMKDISIRSAGLDDVVLFAREVGRNSTVTVVADQVTMAVCGDEVVRLLASDGCGVLTCVVPDGAGGRPHADIERLSIVEKSLDGVDLAVAVGSGTINDLTKLASYNRGIPYIIVATAPSMNGYTSAIAAIMQRGVKRTVECHQPLALVADLLILRAAPQHLLAAGLGDLESKPTCTADYRLGGFLRGANYCPAPERIVLAAEARAASAAQGLIYGDIDSVASLTEALVLSGLSMKLAGSSSPASGGEHLISHYWDMIAPGEGRIEGWHGAQVGVATLVTATLFELLREISPSDIDIDAIIERRPLRDELEQGIRARHGALAEEVIPEFFAKHLSDEDLAQELTVIRDNWNILWSNLGEVLRPAELIRHILDSAGAAITVKDLGLTPGHLIRAFIAAREIRGRFTVLDLAADLGLIEEIRDEVLNKSNCLL